jgi:dolichol-phosphate mannosyltransferase
METLILMPTYNERNNVLKIIPKIFSVVPDCRLMIIDDNSPDGTRKAVESLLDKYPNLQILNRAKKEGLGTAYKEGIKTALKRPEIKNIITMDADGSHNPLYLPSLLDKIKNFDLVVGSRYTEGGGVINWPFKRYLLSRLGNLYAQIIVGLPIKDVTAGFICIRRSLLEKINLGEINSQGYAYQIEFKFKCISQNISFLEIPIIFEDRSDSVSKMSSSIIMEGIKIPWVLLLKKLRSS